MTKEELEKEAEEYAYEKWTDYPEKQEIAEQAYLVGAEPREKRIEELREKLLQEREIYWCKGFECAKKKQSEKLAEATKIIKKLLDTQNLLDSYKDMFKAEEFLKEVSE